MLSSTSCCNPKDLATAHMAPAMANAPEQVTPAHHQAARPTGTKADLLVIGRTVTHAEDPVAAAAAVATAI